MAAQPCTTPNSELGLGVVVEDGLVVTAAHTVDGPLRRLTVDDEPATILALDPRVDLAVLVAPSARGHVDLALEATPAEATVAGATVRISSTGPLVVDDVTDGTRTRREAHRFAPALADGTSGAPLLDADGRVVGIVVLDTYAVTAAELAAVLAGRLESGSEPVPECPR